MTDSIVTRKIPRYLRRMNFAYEIIMVVLGTLNLFLSSLDETWHIPAKYFEVYSVISSILPVMWTKILDVSKKYDAALTPPSSTAPSVRSENSSVASDPREFAQVLELSQPYREQTQEPLGAPHEYPHQVV